MATPGGWSIVQRACLKLEQLVAGYSGPSAGDEGIDSGQARASPAAVVAVAATGLYSPASPVLTLGLDHNRHLVCGQDMRLSELLNDTLGIISAVRRSRNLSDDYRKLVY